MIEEALFDAEEKMEKAVAVARDDLASIRTGRANPGMFSRVSSTTTGRRRRSRSCAASTCPRRGWSSSSPTRRRSYGRSKTRSVTPISGVNPPTNDGNIIRVSIPQLTEERRRDLVKQAKSKGEDAKVSVRNVRRRAMEELHRIRKDGEAGEDEVGRAEKDLDKATATYVGQIEELVKHKEGELLEV